MPQAFGFGFDDEDIEADPNEEPSVAREDGQPRDETPQATHPILHLVEEMLSTLPDSISYSVVELPFLDCQALPDPCHLPRRDLFDIRAQLMAEDDGTDDSVMAGLSNDDIAPNIYEGGFKTWECSMDLASYVNYSLGTLHLAAPKKLHVVELGAGTGLPILSISRHLILKGSPVIYPEIQLTVTDYNASVLHLSTIPNLLIGWATDPGLQCPYSGDLKITQGLRQRYAEALRRLHMNISAISGGWSPALVDVIMQEHPPTTSIEKCDTIILASETIYSPSTIRSFTSTLLGLLIAAEERGSRANAMVAAKRVYFGVGGGVDEFLAFVDEMGGEAEITWESEGQGVGRVVMEVAVGWELKKRILKRLIDQEGQT